MDFTRDLLLDFRNASLFVAAVPCLAAYLYYQYSLCVYGPNEWGAKPFDVMYPYVGTYVAIDLCICTTYEMRLHHLFACCIFFYGQYISSNDRFLLTYPLLKTEISSVFLVLKYWIPETSWIYPINLGVFYITFLKYRIYDYYVELLHNNHLFDFLEKTYPDHYFTPGFLSIYGLYILNLYWAFLLTKIVYKNLFPTVSPIHCHLLCSYLYGLNIPVALLMYPSIHVYDITGLLSLFLFGYAYHRDIYRRCLHEPHVGWCILYALSVQLRSFLSVVTHNPSYGMVSGLIHMFFIAQTSMLHAIETLMEHKNKYQFLKNHRILLSIPLMCDGWFIGTHAPEIKIPLFLIHITLFLQCVVKPFYTYTELSYALEMIVHAYTSLVI